MTALEEAERAGIDLSLIEVSLSCSYDERAHQHQASSRACTSCMQAG